MAGFSQTVSRSGPAPVVSPSVPKNNTGSRARSPNKNVPVPSRTSDLSTTATNDHSPIGQSMKSQNQKSKSQENAGATAANGNTTVASSSSTTGNALLSALPTPKTHKALAADKPIDLAKQPDAKVSSAVKSPKKTGDQQLEGQHNEVEPVLPGPSTSLVSSADEVGKVTAIEKPHGAPSTADCDPSKNDTTITADGADTNENTSKEQAVSPPFTPPVVSSSMATPKNSLALKNLVSEKGLEQLNRQQVENSVHKEHNDEAESHISDMRPNSETATNSLSTPLSKDTIDEVGSNVSTPRGTHSRVNDDTERKAVAAQISPPPLPRHPSESSSLSNGAQTPDTLPENIHTHPDTHSVPLDNDPPDSEISHCNVRSPTTKKSHTLHLASKGSLSKDFTAGSPMHREFPPTPLPSNLGPTENPFATRDLPDLCAGNDADSGIPEPKFENITQNDNKLEAGKGLPNPATANAAGETQGRISLKSKKNVDTVSNARPRLDQGSEPFIQPLTASGPSTGPYYSPSQGCTFCTRPCPGTRAQPTVLCPGCGPFSNIRYCSEACILGDAYGHKRRCQMIPAHQRIYTYRDPSEYIYHRDPIISISSLAESREKFRQKTFVMFCSEQHRPYPQILKAWGRRAGNIVPAEIDIEEKGKKRGSYFVFRSTSDVGAETDVIFVSYIKFLFDLNGRTNHFIRLSLLKEVVVRTNSYSSSWSAVSLPRISGSRNLCTPSSATTSATIMNSER